MNIEKKASILYQIPGILFKSLDIHAGLVIIQVRLLIEVRNNLGFEYTLNDALNLRGLIEMVTEHIRIHGSSESQPRTILAFLNLLLGETVLPDGNTGVWVSTLQKILSGNLSYTKAEPLAKMICSGELDEALQKNLSVLTAVVADLPGADALYGKLLQCVSLRFFSEEERTSLTEKVEKHAYPEFLLMLLRHSFERMYSIPCFYAERLYQEALTYNYDSRLRFALMQEAAVNGSKNAALEYGNYLAKTGPYEEAFEYLIMAAPLPPALWNIAYLIENRWTTSEQYRRFKAVIKPEEKLTSGREFAAVKHELDGLHCPNANPVRAEELVFVYKLYFYLAYRGFFKAFNSMAKMLEYSGLEFDGKDGKQKAETLHGQYIRSAIAGSNVTAMFNEGKRLLECRKAENQFDPNSTEEKIMKELLTVAADMDFLHACYYLGTYYEYVAVRGADGISKKQIREMYERVAALETDISDISGQLYLRLGRLAENSEEQIRWFEKALAAGSSDAAYSLALCYCDICHEEQWPRYLLKAVKLLEDNMPYMSSAYKEKSLTLQKTITSMM